jgi:hypothetical protein
LGWRHGIFEIQNDGVGAALMSLGEKPLGTYRNVEQ